MIFSFISYKKKQKLQMQICVRSFLFMSDV